MLQVSGEISLACSWRVTPLDVVTMKVKQQQAEVDHKEEILALLQVISPFLMSSEHDCTAMLFSICTRT